MSKSDDEMRQFALKLVDKDISDLVLSLKPDEPNRLGEDNSDLWCTNTIISWQILRSIIALTSTIKELQNEISNCNNNNNRIEGKQSA